MIDLRLAHLVASELDATLVSSVLVCVSVSHVPSLPHVVLQILQPDKLKLLIFRFDNNGPQILHPMLQSHDTVELRHVFCRHH